MTPNITDTFTDGTILVTGSTGFLGKLLCDKLLRSCPFKTLAVLVRSKKELNAVQRTTENFNKNIFDQLRKDKPDFMSSIKVIDGNIEEHSLGLSSVDRKWLVENVNFIFHCAATIKFNEPIKKATKINVEGTRNLLALATEINNLKGFVHVSTAYSQCPRSEIKEQYYPISITAKELKNALDDDEPPLDIIEKWPNTYTFTKAVTENMISTDANHLPISIFRPSIVGCTNSEPIPGWFENVVGPPGIITACLVGIIRAVLVDEKKVFDLVPADYTVNALISVMWDTVNRYKDTNQINDLPKIYNFVSGAENPLTWGEYIDTMHANYKESPSFCGMWYVFTFIYTNLWIGKISRFWLNYIPAILMNILLIFQGKKPKMLKIYTKTENLIEMYKDFTTREWKFDNSHTQNLWLSINQEDRELFPFSIKDINWNSYIKSYFHGIRKYILHEELDNLEEARAKQRKLYILHIFTVTLFVYCVFRLCSMCL